MWKISSLFHIFGEKWWIWPLLVVLSLSLSLAALRGSSAASAVEWRAAFYTYFFCLVFCQIALDPIVFILAYSVAGGVHSGLCLIIRRTDSVKTRWPEVLVANLVLLVVFVELGYRVLARITPSPLLSAPDMTIEKRLLHYRLRPGELMFGFPCNSQGYYDAPFLTAEERQSKVVLCIGDSFSSITVPHRFHYTTVAEKNLRDIEVYNLGVASIGPREYDYILRNEGLALKPDLIVIALFLGNDISDLVHEENPHFELFSARIIRHLLDVRTHAPILARAQSDYMETYPTFSPEKFLTIETQRAEFVCDESHDFSEFGKALEAVIKTAGSIPIAFVLIPDEFQVEEELWEAVSEASPRKLNRDHPQQWTRSWLKKRELPYLDLLLPLRELPVKDDGRRHCYRPRDTHFNILGNRVAGEEFAKFLTELEKTGWRPTQKRTETTTP